MQLNLAMTRNLHNLILAHATMVVSVHTVDVAGGVVHHGVVNTVVVVVHRRSTVVAAVVLVQVLDEAKTKSTATVLVTLELGDSSLGRLAVVKADNAGTARATTGLVLNLSLLNLADSHEEVNEIIVASRPGELEQMVSM